MKVINHSIDDMMKMFKVTYMEIRATEIQTGTIIDILLTETAKIVGYYLCRRCQTRIL